MTITFSKLALSYLLTTLVFFMIDLTWLGLIARSFYAKHLGPLLADQVNWIAAIVFYLLFIAGIFIFAILPAVERASLSRAMLYGGLFGFFTYATYDLTNLATLKGWPMTVVLVDIAWGVVLTALVSTAGYLIVRWVG